MKKKIQEILDSVKDYITSHEYEDAPVLTLYANVDPTDADNRRDQPKWAIELANEAKRLKELHGEETLKRRDVQLKWAEAEEKIAKHLMDRKPTGQSVVIFTDLEDYLTVDLPVPLPTRMYYGAPQLKHLLFALDQHKKYLTILFSEEGAKAVEVFLTAATDQFEAPTGTKGGFSLRPGGRKARTQASERRDLGTERSAVSEAAERINAYFLGDPEFDRVVFGGNLKIAHAVKNALHPAVADVLVTIEPIPFEASPDEIAERIREVADQNELEHDSAVVNDLVTRQHACGKAVLERQGVGEAVENGQASQLVFPYPTLGDDFDELMANAVINNVEIEFVTGEAAEKLEQFGGVGATLYYSGR